MKTGEAVLVVGAIAGFYIWNLQRAAGNLVYFPGDITDLQLSGLSPVITAELVVQNTSNIDFTINSIAGNVLSDSTQIGNVSNFTPAIIKSNSQNIIPLTLTLQPIGIVNELIEVFTGGVGSRKLTVQGSINANGTQLPLLLEFQIGS